MGRLSALHKPHEKVAVANLPQPQVDGDLGFEERLRVKMALKTMRKAHVHGSLSERER